MRPLDSIPPARRRRRLSLGAAVSLAALTGAGVTWNLRQPMSMRPEDAHAIARQLGAQELETRGAIVLLLRDSRKAISLLDDLADQGNEQAVAALRHLKVQIDEATR